MTAPGSDGFPEGWPGVSAVISDLDGVVYRGTQPIDSAVAAFRTWAEAGLPYAFVTNNSTASPEDFAAKLCGMGVPVTPGRIVTSAETTADLVAAGHPRSARVMVVGAPALRAAIEARGFALSDHGAEVVVVGLDRGFDFDRLGLAQRALMAGAAFYGTNADPMLPKGDGFEPGAGSILQAVATASGRVPRVVGKPAPDMVLAALARLGRTAAETLMIGDQPATDIAAGRAAGLRTVLVRTGVAFLEAEAAAADLTLDTLQAFARLILARA